ncbi:MAG: right-handed parallel beta-helix repeat-containing protein [Fimbriimonadia bacterium]|nr:right-handed parallel beta-helix repeat-containing protein [Fimbriimonadia bacterium]
MIHRGFKHSFQKPSQKAISYWKYPVRLLFMGFALPALIVWAAVNLDNSPYPQMRLVNGHLVPNEPFKPGEEPHTGLQKPFPPMLTREDNPTTVERVELGKMLFFDPILSGDNKMSCAHCHHPDQGFSDGLARSRGKGATGVGKDRMRAGLELTRGAPSLWNAYYYHRQFWDGRASDLEDQARFPIQDPTEMHQDPEALVKELKAIPEYVRLFDKAFGGQNGSALTFANLQNAIAAFERTLVSLNSRFDRYAAGEGGALTPQEKNGLKLFLSPKTRCNECHGIPTFANRDFKVIGVPDPEGGPADVHKEGADPDKGGGPKGAFKIPTLRNVALTAPYMHNGQFATLEEVLDFYSKGGGRGQGLEVPLQDDKIRKFDLTDQEKADLVAFMLSLTDDSAKPSIPRRVPSGLPVVGRAKPNPPTNLKLAQSPSAGGRVVSAPTIDRRGTASFASSAQRPTKGRVVEVKEGESIQEAVDKAGRDGTVRIYPGTYHESVMVIHHGVTIEGITQNGKRPVIDGKGKMADAVAGMGNRFKIRNLDIKNYQGNGVVIHDAKDVTFQDLYVENTGLYGVYPVGCDGVLVEGCKVTKISDAGVYVGQSRNIVVRNNECYGNVAGIEIENSVNAVVEDNNCYDNTGGILVFLLPFNPSKVADNCIVRRNRIVNNNVPNWGDPNAIVSQIPKGSGLIILAADQTVVYDNEISGNESFGIAVLGLSVMYPPNTKYDVEPMPDNNWIHSNKLKDNGKNPHEMLKKMGVPGSDLIWDLSGKGNAWDQPGASAFPPALPTRKAEK